MTRRRPTPRTSLAVSVVAFTVLALAALGLGVSPADTVVRDRVLEATSPALLVFLHVVNYAGTWIVLLPGTIALFFAFRDARRRWWVWTALMLAAPAAETLLKHVIRRPRPEALTFGFPSGHATAAAAFFGAVIFLAEALPLRAARAVRAGAVLVIVLVGLARVMLHAHWPSDVLGGIALGIALASAAALLAEE